MKTSPLFTDLYQFTMMQGYFDQQMEQTAIFEFFVRKLPDQRNFLIAAGLQQVIEYLENLSFSDEDINYLRTTGFFHDQFLAYLKDVTFVGNVHGVPEGTVVFAGEPLIRITAPLPVAQLVETRIINILMFQTMIASKAVRMRLTAPDEVLIDFGLRRAHGEEAGLLAARAGYLAGLNGTATVEAGLLFDIPLFGTMAHSFVQAHDSEMEAFRNFAKSQPDNVVLLIDTYDTEKGAEKVVALAPELLADDIVIKGVRIDSGDLVVSARKVRAILDRGGLQNTKIFLSSSLDEYSLSAIKTADAPVDGYGIGTKMITSSDYPFLDCSYKLVEYDGKGRRKRSAAKETWPGPKQVYRQYDDNGFLQKDILTVETDTLPGRPLIEVVMQNGKLLHQLPSLMESREHAQAELVTLPKPFRQVNTSASYTLEISSALRLLTEKVDAVRDAVA